ncbi:hypothetical protein vBEcoMWL3_gp107 [Escherichia phage vB_EcoM_WL-3]|nr:hypothetical protein vBEcoMWL3_gp107 [Escherichia phage vB_EcoM_WL-3]
MPHAYELYQKHAAIHGILRLNVDQQVQILKSN